MSKLLVLLHQNFERFLVVQVRNCIHDEQIVAFFLQAIGAENINEIIVCGLDNKYLKFTWLYF
jgi:hypothetical protein